MDSYTDMLMYILPSLVVVLVVFLLIRMFLGRDTEREKSRLREINRKAIAPLQLQAYERITLFLERIIPMNLINRAYKQGFSGKQLYTELLRAIREEYEHNMSQQLYIGISTWELVRNAKESVIQTINEAYGETLEGQNAENFTQAIIKIYLQQKKPLVERALDQLKDDINNRY